MRIISSFTDYYDGVASAGAPDPQDRIYLRKMQTIKRPKNLPGLPHNHSASRLDLHVILFAGHMYVGIKITDHVYKGATYNQRMELCKREYNPGKFVFTMESYMKAFASFPREEQKRLMSPMHKHSTKIPLDIRRNLLDGNPYPAPVEFFREHDAPVMYYEWAPNVAGWHDDHLVTLNPRLADTGFPAALDAQQATQELDMFLHTLLLEHPRPMVTISDENRLLAHGFDKKTSFRKAKGS